MIQRYFKLLFFCPAFLFLTFCSSKESEKQNVAIQFEDNLPHDPFSSKLIAATNAAEAKNFEALLLSGEKFAMAEQKGNVVVLNIWATWCQPCAEEMPDLADMYNKYKDNGLVILGISIDEQGESVVVPFIKKYNVTYPIVIDDGTITKKYPATMGIPATYIIGPKGYLRYFSAGALTKKELKPRIEKLLKEG